MADFIQQALELSPRQAPQWLEPRHKSGRLSWQAKTVPSRKTEHWKYTNLRVLEQGCYLGEPQPIAIELEENLREHFAIGELDACVLVFVNGRFSATLSDADVPHGVDLVPFSRASAAQVEQIGLHLGTVAKTDKHMFAALNDSWLQEGVFVRVAANTRVEQPLHIVWLTTAQTNPFSVSQRLLVIAESGSEATVLEHFASDKSAQNSFTNGVTELVLEANSRVHHYRLHLEEENALHIGGVHASLARDAVLNSFHLALGAKLKRIDVVINHNGEGAHCDLNGVYLPRHSQHVDYHTCIEHTVPRCTTNENFRGIVADSAKAVFNGRIHIHPNAQKTLAQLSNKNLLTSDKAEVDTKPELEIYADDVQCAHGATVAQLDEQAVYYLRSRGVSKKEADVMLSFGFINELVDKVSHQSVARYLRPLLAGLFAREPQLARHIAP